MTDRNDAQRQAVVVPRQDGHFTGKVAFITGATSGIDRPACDRTIPRPAPGRPADPRGSRQ